MFEFFSTVIMPSLLTAIGWGIAPILDRKALVHINNNYQKAFIIKILAASVFSVIIYLFSTVKIDVKESETQKGIMYLAGSAFFATIVAYYFYYKALNNSNNTSLVVFITYITPLIIVSILSAIFLKEKINIGMIVSMIICIIGISMFIYYSNKGK